MDQEIKLGRKVDDVQAIRPESIVIQGKYVRLEPFNSDNMYKSLYDNYKETPHVWDYVFDYPPNTLQEYHKSCNQKMKVKDRVIYGVYKVGDLDDCVGHLSLMRIQPTHRVIEVGGITFSAKLQNTTGSTEAIYLLMKYCLENLKYLRFEWKCNAQNQPSKKAAVRLGFTYEGTFRQHMIIKNHSRDTAWFSIIDIQWPIVKKQMERWLSPDNFDEKGIQKTKLSIHHEKKGL